MERAEWQRRGEGHRQRLRDKFLAQGIDAFTDAEIIELLLTFGTPRSDCKEAARELLARFGSLPAVLDAAPVQLQQVIINLMLNAFDASAGVPADRRRVVVETRDTAHGVQLGVRDLGSGIAADDLPRVFDSFFSTKHSGMGLGLSICRGFVEAMGGRITAANRTERSGAVFTIRMPVPAEIPLLGGNE